ncbi:putative cytochrome P450 [Clohesyomyces aquaticus]|uniref:Putative cytochrome P450 n=1 Tax=Clohesyomyces aquaticus TaxID=1231657 RepID=A0A1Y1YYV4_9PLEO|nr:putative cytochrome P450 [Clohesyomyces aquaticus]
MGSLSNSTSPLPLALNADEQWSSKLLATCGLAAITFIAVSSWLSSSKEPPSLWDKVPFVSNTLQFLTNNELFMKRTIKLLEGRNLAKFWLGPIKFYLITGPQNMQTLFGRGNRVGNEDIFVHNVFPVLYKMPKEHVQRFADDKSGRGKVPAPGFEKVPQEKRFWASYEHVHTEYLARTAYLKPVIEVFRGIFSDVLEHNFKVGESNTISVIGFCKHEVTESAMKTLLGPTIFELNPTFLDAFWEFDDNVFMLTLGFPKWLYSRPYKAHDRYLGMIENYAKSAKAKFDWDGPQRDSPWEPHFGARVCREIAKWFTEADFLDQSVSGALGALLFAQNSNTIPTTMWMILELARDPVLLKAVKEEVATTEFIDSETGQRSFDIQKLATLPLLQSVFTETLRLRMNFNIIRQVKEPFTVDGFTLKKGSMLQAPMMVAHHDEAVWGSTGHPASVFWAERHIKYLEDTDDFGNVTQKRTFAMAGRPSSYFPFGGGPPVCPGRHFSKHEIMTTVGLMVSKFEFESIEWTQLDGSPSDRMASSDQRYCGAGAMPPDRDMKIRWKRIW